MIARYIPVSMSAQLMVGRELTMIARLHLVLMPDLSSPTPLFSNLPAELAHHTVLYGLRQSRFHTKSGSDGTDLMLPPSLPDR
jgi:hypothetical protein